MTFEVTDGWLKITPIDVVVTIVGANSTDPYDGDAHTVTGYTATAANELYDVTKDFTFTGEAKATRTNVVEGEDADGQTDMGLAAGQFANTNPNFGTVTFNVTDGYQRILPITVTVTITGHHNTTTYDGQEHSVSGYDVEFSNNLYTEADFVFTPAEDAILVDGEIGAKRTEVGKTEVGLEPGQFANTNPNFDNVSFTVTDGYQAITPIDEVVVTITGHHNTTDYDGAEHKVAGYDVEISNPLYKETDFTFSGSAAAARTNVVEGEDTDGQTDMGLTAEQFTNTNENFKKVTFNVTDGYQKITPINVTVTITEHSDKVDYDGEEHTVTGYDVEISNPLYTEADFTFSGADTVNGTDAGSYDMELTPEDFTNTNDNFANVTFVIVDGQLVINPIDVTVTITEHSDEVDYDGEEHTVTGYDVSMDNDLYTEADFTFSGADTVNGTDAGSYDMELTPEDFTNTNDNFANVTFVIVDGQLVIDPIDVTVTITEHSDKVDYDGEEHTVTGYDVEISNPLYTEADFTFSGIDTVNGVEVGSYDMELEPEDFTNTNGNFAIVNFVIVDGQLEIDPIDVTVTITEHSDEVDYDGEEHTVTGYDVSINNKLYTEADFTFNGTDTVSGTDAGSYDMELTPEDFANTNNNFATVTFVIVDGQLVIDPIDVTVTIVGANSTDPYDGKSYTVKGYTAEADIDLYDVTKDFTFTPAADAALVDGEIAATRSDVGTTNMGLKTEQFKNTNPNFGTVTFEVTDGYQTINPIDVTVTITGHSSTDDYDGAEHSVSGYDVQISNPLYKEADFSFSGTAEAARTDVGTTKMGLAENQFTNTNTNFGTVTFNVTDGYQTINPIDVTVTITGHNSTDDYDGTEHSVSGYDV